MADSSSAITAESEPFRVEVHAERADMRVVPVGELDIATVGEIGDRLRDLRQAGCRRLVLDLRRLTFLDSSGLRLILECDRAARRDGISFTISHGPPAVRRIFELAGLLDTLAFRT